TGARTGSSPSSWTSTSPARPRAPGRSPPSSRSASATTATASPSTSASARKASSGSSPSWWPSPSSATPATWFCCSTSPACAGRQTLTPLLGAFGYQLASRLQLAPDTLLVHGPTELLYLEVLSGFLRDNGHDFLDPRWVLVPAGGLDGVPLLAALLGAPLEAA